jgi:WD40 repeat protein
MVLSGHQGAVLSVRFSPDGRLLATKSSDNTVWLWDCHDWQPVAVLQETVKSDLCNGLSFHPNKHQLATLSHDQKGIRVWELDYSLLLGDNTVKKLKGLVCPTCAEPIPASMVQRRQKRGHNTLTCPVCEMVIVLLAEDIN